MSAKLADEPMTGMSFVEMPCRYDSRCGSEPGPLPSCQPTIIADGAPALMALASSSVRLGRFISSRKPLPLEKLLMLIFAT